MQTFHETEATCRFVRFVFKHLFKMTGEASLRRNLTQTDFNGSLFAQRVENESNWVLRFFVFISSFSVAHLLLWSHAIELISYFVRSFFLLTDPMTVRQKTSYYERIALMKLKIHNHWFLNPIRSDAFFSMQNKN